MAEPDSEPSGEGNSGGNNELSSEPSGEGNNEPNRVYRGDAAEILPTLPPGVFQMVYADPPFNTGKVQRRLTLQTVGDAEGDRTGFQGRRFRTVAKSSREYADVFDDYLGFLEPLVVEAWRTLSPTGTFYLHLDYREVHYAKVMLDGLFGREHFLNEIVWAYDYGARSKRKWPAKHDNILVYVKDPDSYFFDAEAVDREPYMAPGLVGPEKAARGKLPTDTWWHTIVPTSGAEKTGYPNQKPEGIVRRMVQASTAPGDWVLDFCAGSGTLGAVAQQLGRRFVLIDDNPAAVEVMKMRLGAENVDYVVAGGSTAPSLRRRARVADSSAAATMNAIEA